jgi:cation diffusion facilitator CzcD-associated flavoprotein CzcO
VYAGDGHNPAAVAAIVSSTMLANTSFDRRTLALGTNTEALPTEAEVVVIGGGLLGMVAAQRLLKNGRKVVILEQRSLVGGIWSMHANSTSQVNSSEGGYCLKEFLPEDSPRKHQHNRDHSTAAEVLADLAEFGASLKEHIHLQTQVVQVLGTDGDYHVVVTQHGSLTSAVTKVIKCSGVVLAINDRVGMPRSLSVPGMDSFKERGGVMADGTSDLLKNCDWRGKRVVVFGMGAFAVENVRTALESGAEHVTVVARRLGTVCPKMIDYLNFVKPNRSSRGPRSTSMTPRTTSSRCASGAASTRPRRPPRPSAGRRRSSTTATRSASRTSGSSATTSASSPPRSAPSTSWACATE